MTDCILCGEEIDQVTVLQTIIDTKEDEESHINWLKAKRAVASELDLSQSDLTVRALKKHTERHVYYGGME